MKKIISLFLLILASGFTHAGVILTADSVTENTMGELICCGNTGTASMLNQSGLSSTYTSGVTDFDTFVGSGVTHSGGDGSSWLSSSQIFSGYLVFDLGGNYNVQDFVMWNGTSGITASVNGFSLSTSLVSDFSVSTFAGSFTGQQSNYNATVYDMTDTTARYVRLDIEGNFGNGCCIGIGDIAFNVSSAASTSVPEPGSLLLLSLSLMGAGFARKKSLA